MIRRLAHIGVVVENLDDAVSKYCGFFGFSVLEPACDLPRFGLKVIRLAAHGIELELAEPLTGSAGVRFGVHHLAFVSDDLAADFRKNVGRRDDVNVPENGATKAFLPPDPGQGGLVVELIAESIQKEERQ